MKAIEPRVTPAGAKVNAIVIENDGEFKEAEFQAKPYQDMTRDEVLAAIKDASGKVIYEFTRDGKLLYDG